MRVHTMKRGLAEIMGRTIVGVVAAENSKSPPHRQVFLVFSDGTYFEFHGDSFTCNNGVNAGGITTATNYALNAGAKIMRSYPDK